MRKLFFIFAAVLCLAANIWAGEPRYEIRSVLCNVDATENNVHGLSFFISAEVYDNFNGMIICEGDLLLNADPFDVWNGVVYNPDPQDNRAHSKLDIRSESCYIVHGETKTAVLCENDDVIKNFRIFIPHSVITHPAGQVKYLFSFAIRNADSKACFKNKVGECYNDYPFSLDWPEEWPKKVRIEKKTIVVPKLEQKEEAKKEPKVEPKKESKVSITNEDWKQIDKAEWEFRPRSKEIGETDQSYVVSVIVEQDVYSKQNRLRVRESISGMVDFKDLDELSGNYEIGFYDELTWRTWVSFIKEGNDLTKCQQVFITQDELGDVTTVDTCDVIEVRGSDGKFHCAEKCVLQTIAQFSKKYQVINPVKADKGQRPTYVYQLGSTLPVSGNCPQTEMRIIDRHRSKYFTARDWHKDSKTDPTQFGTILNTYKIPVKYKKYDPETNTFREGRREFTVYQHNTDNNKADFECISIGDGSGYYFQVEGVAAVNLHILGRFKDKDIRMLEMYETVIWSPAGNRLITNSDLSQIIYKLLNTKQNHSKIRVCMEDHPYYHWDLDIDGMMSNIEKPE